MAVDAQKLDAFLGKFVGDLGAALHAGTVVLGEKLGLYKALAAGPMTAAELAAATSTDARYVAEWLAAQAASGYAEYDAPTQRFSLTEEQAFALATEDSPAYVPGAFQLTLGAQRSTDKIAQAFRTGLGFGWHQHHDWLFRGTEKFFRPGYAANLVASWIPALDGVEAKLKRGARVADVGCGLGASTILMAQAYPNSQFFGFDYHAPSLEWARESAQGAGVSERVTFETTAAKDFPGSDYDFVAMFDCLHDMGDPVGASAHILQSLRPDGTWMIVEPFANDKLEDNLNPVGRIFYCASTMICTPASRSQEVGRALGAQAGESKLREVVQSGGFTRFRRATQTPFNLVLEARP